MIWWVGLFGVLAAAAGGLVFATARIARQVEAALPPAGRFVEVNGLRLHVLERGEGPALLLVHGLAGNLGHFNMGVIERLAPHHRVVAVDRPGAGYSQAPAAPLSLQAQADVLAALAAQLGLGRVLVVGHSLGGAVALAMALRHPAAVAGLALVAPLTHVPEDAPAAFGGLAIARPWLRRAVAWTLATPASIRQRDKILGLVFGPEAVPKDFATRGGGLLGLRPPHFITASRDLNMVPDSLPELEARYGELRLPVDVLFARDDRILGYRANGQALAARLPGTRLTLVDGGHMLPVTQPERVAGFIQAAAQRAFA